MFKLISDYLEARRQRKHWLYMTKLMNDRRGPAVVQSYPTPPSNAEKRYP